MNRRSALLIASALVLLVGIAIAVAVIDGSAPTNRRTASGPTYRNPVYHHDAPDPSIVRAPDGTFYAYTTQSPYETGLVDIPILHSADLVHWKYVGDAFPKLPRWVGTDMWAPHVTRFRAKYFMYYSGRNAFSGNMNIGVATAEEPAGPWRDIGHPLIKGPTFTTIDPFVLSVPGGNRYLVWGSAGIPITAQRLARDGLSLIGKPKPLVYPSLHRLYHHLLEGAWIIPHGDYYYLFASGDACCNAEAFYAVMAWRSKNPMGPYEEDPDNPVLALNSHFTAPGHNSTITDDAGETWILYHAIRPDDPLFSRALFINKIDWTDGWPTINDGHGPSWKPTTAPVIGKP